MYTKEHRAFQLGWELIKSIEVKGDGVQAPGAVTMCGLPENPYHPFVIHFFNEQDGGFHAGDYCKDRASAEEAYTKRALRFMSFKQE